MWLRLQVFLPCSEMKNVFSQGVDLYASDLRKLFCISGFGFGIMFRRLRIAVSYVNHLVPWFGNFSLFVNHRSLLLYIFFRC